MKYLMNLILLGLIVINFIKLSFLLLFKKVWRDDLFWSLGIKKVKIPERKQGKIRIWVHAVSLGETKAIESFIIHIKQELPDVEIIKSSITKTGHARSLEKKEIFDYSFYLPIDFSWRARRLAKKINPDLFLLVENDYWPNLLLALKAQGTKVALINGRLSTASYDRYSMIPGFAKRLFSSFDIMCLQSELYRTRFCKLGVSENCMHITGNIKFDAKSVMNAKSGLVFPENKKIITIASTHDGEEKLILKALREMDDSVCLMIAPRHPARFSKVAELIEQEGIRYRRINEEGHGDEKVILVDMMGVLDECFKKSSVAVLGGSFISDIGGHNIFEPVRLGTPVIYGPYMHKQEILVDQFKKHKVGRQVELKNLKQTLEGYLNGKFQEERVALLINEVAGATERSWNVIKKL